MIFIIPLKSVILKISSEQDQFKDFLATRQQISKM